MMYRVVELIETSRGYTKKVIASDLTFEEAVVVLNDLKSHMDNHMYAIQQEK